MNREIGPVFIVGFNGSGTTMLADSLGRHPGLYILPTESRVLPYFAQRYSDEDLASPSAKRAMADALGATRGFRVSNSMQALRLPNAEGLPPSFSAIVAEMYMTLARTQGKTRWGDKSPMYMQHLSLLAARFPDARFLHIHRDARDAAQSFHRRWRQNPRRSVYRWKQAIRACREQGTGLGPEKYMEVSYAAVAADAEHWMRQICVFLDLPFHPAVLESTMRMMDAESRKLAQGRIVQNNDRWKRYFDLEEVAELERIAGAALADFGYEVSRYGDANPSKIQLMLWKAMDRFNAVLQHLRTRGIERRLFYRVRDALRQDESNKF